MLAMRNKKPALQELYLVLKNITGGSRYHTNLDGRVYRRLILPDANPNLMMPYVCIVTTGRGKYVGDADDEFERVWHVSIHVFTRMKPDSYDDDSAEELADLEDDIVKAILIDSTLNGTATSVEVTDVEVAAGLEDGLNFSEMVLGVAVSQVGIAVETLGPS